MGCRFRVAETEWRTSSLWVSLDTSPSWKSKGLTIFSEKGVSHANRNDWSWKDGCEYGAAASYRRPSVRGLRQVAKSSAGVGRGKGRWLLLPCGLCEEGQEAAVGLVDGSGGGR